MAASQANLWTFVKTATGAAKPAMCGPALSGALAGAPAHVYENLAFDNGSSFLSTGASTSETLSRMLRWAIRARASVTAMDPWPRALADFIVANLIFLVSPSGAGYNTVLPHWELDIFGGAAMETVVRGAYDTGGTLNFTNGVATIVAANGGDKVVNVRAVYTTNAQFTWDGYWAVLANDTSGNPIGTTYTIASFVNNGNGTTTVTLNDLTQNGNRLIYYSYKNGDTLAANTLYGSYPRPHRSLANPITATLPLWVNKPASNFWLESATDAALWLALGLWEAGNVLSRADYQWIAGLIYSALRAASTIPSPTLWFQAASAIQQGASSLYQYSNGTRTLTATLSGGGDYEFDYGATGGSTNVGFGVALAKAWNLQTSKLQLIASGQNSGKRTQLTLSTANPGSATTRYRWGWIDDFYGRQTWSIPRADIIREQEINYDPQRADLAPYTFKGASDTVSYVQNDTAFAAFADSQGTHYSRWLKAVLTVAVGSTAGVGVPFAAPDSGKTLRLVLAGSVANGTLQLNIVDKNGTKFSVALAAPNPTTPQELTYLLSATFAGAVYPLQDVEVAVVQSGAAAASATLWINKVAWLQYVQFTATSLAFFQWERNDAASGSILITSLQLLETQSTKYTSAIMVFTANWSNLGAGAWHGPAYVGYQHPMAHFALGDSAAAEQTVTFLKDAQNDYKTKFPASAIGPFTPVFLLESPENLVWGTLGTFVFAGPDPNFTWGGFQYRALAALAEYYYYSQSAAAKSVLANWFAYLHTYITANNAIPDTYKSDGTVTSAAPGVGMWALARLAANYKLGIDAADADAQAVFNFADGKIQAAQVTNQALAKFGAFSLTPANPTDTTYGYEQADCGISIAGFLTAAQETGAYYMPNLQIPSGGNQEVTEKDATSSVGNFSARCIDPNDILKKAAAALNLIGKSVQLKMGFAGLASSEFVAVETRQITATGAESDGRTSIECADPQTLLAGASILSFGGPQAYVAGQQAPAQPLGNQWLSNGYAIGDKNPRYIQGNPIDILLAILQNEVGLGQDPSLPPSLVVDPTAGASFVIGFAPNPAWTLYQPGQAATLINPNSLIDVPGFLALRDGMFSGTRFEFKLTRGAQAKQWLEDQILKPLGLYFIVRADGHLALKSMKPQPPVSTVFDFTKKNIVGIPAVSRLDLINVVTYRLDSDNAAAQTSSRNFQRDIVLARQNSINQSRKLVAHTVESYGTRTNLGGTLLAEMLSNQVFNRHANQAPVYEFEAFLSAIVVELGDYVTLTHPLIPDIIGGGRGLTSVTCEVIGRAPDYATGKIKFKLLDGRFIGLTNKSYQIASSAAGIPAWSSASAAQRAQYMFISSAAGGVNSDGTPGNTIF